MNKPKLKVAKFREADILKPYRKWNVTYKVGAVVVSTKMHGQYELEDVKKHLGLTKPEVEWYKIEEDNN